MVFAEAVGGLVYEILSDIGDVLMQPADPGLCFLPVIRKFLLASQPTLQLRELPGVLLERRTLADNFAVGHRHEVDHAPIYTDQRSARVHHGFDFSLRLDGDEDFASDNRYRYVLRLAFNVPRLAVAHPANLGQRDTPVAAVDFESWKFIKHRVADPRMLRLIQKWLKAGVSEDGQWSETKMGTPQGAVASPLIANVYLHYLFDLWADVWRRKVAQGDVIVVRYADDLVVGFQHRMDAERFLREFRERLAKFGLELHPDKTRLIEFGRFAARDRKARGEEKPETFTFLGFTHYCGQRHKSGTFTVWRITAKKRMVVKLKAIKVELQRRMHDRIADVGAWLRKVVLGYYQYHAVPGNTTQLRIFKLRVCRLWQSILVRRSQRAKMRWERLTPVLNRWIPPPRVLHPYPDARFYATHPS